MTALSTQKEWNMQRETAVYFTGNGLWIVLIVCDFQTFQENHQALASDVHVVEESLSMVDDCLNLLDKSKKLHKVSVVAIFYRSQGNFIAPFNNMRTLKFKTQLTIAFFAAVNHKLW